MNGNRLHHGLAAVVALVVALVTTLGSVQAATLAVTDAAGQPLATAKVREVATVPTALDTSDNGYPAPGQVRRVDPEITRFTDADGRASWADRGVPVTYHVRKPGYRDASVSLAAGSAEARIVLEPETDALKLAEARPANVWLGALDLGPAGAARDACRGLAPAA